MQALTKPFALGRTQPAENVRARGRTDTRVHPGRWQARRPLPAEGNAAPAFFCARVRLAPGEWPLPDPGDSGARRHPPVEFAAERIQIFSGILERNVVQ